MEEPRAAARGRAIRSISAATKSNRVLSANTFRRHSSAHNAAKQIEAISSEETKTEEDEIAVLRLLLQERVEQVGLLEALVSEKKFLQRQDDALEDRVRFYEEQLTQISSVLKRESPTKIVSHSNTHTSLPKRKKEDINSSTNKRDACAREIMDKVQQLRYEKYRMESELAKKDRALEVLKTELQLAQENAKQTSISAEIPFKKNENEISSIETPLLKEENVSKLEKKLVELYDKQTRTEEKLINFQKDYRVAKQTLREREKELLESQRKIREVTRSHKNQFNSQNKLKLSIPLEWNEVEKMVSSSHRHFFHGLEWINLVNEKPEAMRNAFLKDLSLELFAPYGFISVVQMNPGPEVVAIEVEVRRPVSVQQEQVDQILLECPFNSMKKLLQCKDEPKEGLDLLQEKFDEMQKVLATKEDEITTLQKRLQWVESSFNQQKDDRDVDDNLFQHMLDETEETIKVMYNELEKQRVKEEKLQTKLKQVTESLEERENTITEIKKQLKEMGEESRRQAERASQQIEEIRSKSSSEIREIELKRRQEVSALRQQIQQQLRKSSEAPQLVTHTITLHWNESEDDKKLLLSEGGKEVEINIPLDGKCHDILRVLLLGEVATLAKVTPVQVISLHCTSKEVKAELQLQLQNSSSSSSELTRISGIINSGRAPTSLLFLQEWRDMRGLVEFRGKDIQRLAQLHKNTCDELEKIQKEKIQLETQLQEAHSLLNVSQTNQTTFTEEMTKIALALEKVNSENNSSLSLVERVNILVKQILTFQQETKLQERQNRSERIRVRGIETEKQRLAEMLQLSKKDLEKATDALEALHNEHQEYILQERERNDKVQSMQLTRLAELQANRKFRNQLKKQSTLHDMDLKKSKVEDENKKNDNIKDDIFFSALLNAYEEYDALYDKYENITHQWRLTEKLQREKLQESEAESEKLNLQLNRLKNDIEEKEQSAALAVSNQHKTENERDELVERIRHEMQSLSRRMMKNDTLHRKTELAKKALEQEVEELTKNCEAHKVEREKLEEAMIVLKDEANTLKHKVQELQNEMATRSERVEELVKQLVHEEDARREVEMELVKTRQIMNKTTVTNNSTKTTRTTRNSSEVGKEVEERKSVGIPSKLEMKRLRNFCLNSLQIPITEKENSLAEIITFMEQHYNSTLKEKEQFTAALLSMNTAIQLLKQCVSITEEQKEGPIRRTRASSGTNTNTNITPNTTNTNSNITVPKFGRSLSYNSGIAPPLLSARTPRFSRRESATPTPLKRAESGHQHLQNHHNSLNQKNNNNNNNNNQHQQRRGSTDSKTPTLATTAAEVLYFSQLLSSVVSYWRENEQRNSLRIEELSKKCKDLKSELERAPPYSLMDQNSQHSKQQKRQKETCNNNNNVNDNSSLQDDNNEDFLRRSRAHALCIVLSVKDHLHDALAAIPPLSHTLNEVVISNSINKLPVDSIYDLRMVEDCVVYALKRIVQSANSIFSLRERCEIEGKRGVSYFTIPNISSPTVRPHSPPARYQQQQQQVLLFQTTGLVPRDVNVSSSSSSTTQMEKQRSVSRDVVNINNNNNSTGIVGGNSVDYMQRMSREDQHVIQQALKEARRRNR